MRKITIESVDAFMNARKFKKANMEVEVLPNVTILKLHGNEIAYRYKQVINKFGTVFALLMPNQ